MFVSYGKKVLLFFLSSIIICSLSSVSLAVSGVGPGFSSKVISFLNRGRYQDAYNLTKTNSSELGDKSYDMLLGRAALAVAKPDEAAMAFERVLMQDPNLLNARFGLSEAYYALGLYDDAKRELNTLISERYKGVKPNVLIFKQYSLALDSNIKALSDKINKKLSARDREYHFYGRVVFGSDSNVAASTDEDYAGFASLTGTDIAPDPSSSVYSDQVAALNDLYYKLRQYNDKPKSFYLYPSIGVKGKHFLSDTKYTLFWDLNGSHKEYTQVDNYDVNQANATLGVNYQINPLYLLNGTAYYQEYMVDGDRYREAPLGALSLSRVLNSNNILKLYTNDGFLIYP
ncbi:MAG: tetratricopeptide repeat protein, partial [Gammaproteobacteria bacterium]|nr:tetratricopeptide repeat protein [Gammaproteobacteria bacterium]